MKIKKAVITAGGLGTRLLPTTKAVPKEMIPIVDKPAIQYIAEECAAAGITDILIVTARGKTAIEDHFDRSPELEAKLAECGKTELLEEIKGISSAARFTFVRQPFQTGLGGAILCAESFVGGEPFAVLYGDDVIIGEDPAVGQLARAYEKYGKSVVGINRVPREDICKYNSMKLEPMGESRLYAVSDMIEKPQRGEEFSDFSILGRCILEPNIFDILRRTPRGKGGELQLTDAMREVAVSDGMIGVDFTGKRFDMGSRLGIIKASLEVGLMHDELKEELAEYLKELLDSMRNF
ncbi:MAG: UTP--glucose-1-phosphate uridylyltransferase [Oscillospiraceae bacterium]|nr:UTP--glucose-1-phosphate uridylyltransferase [Oscillospiraceae bacterium]